MNFFAERKILNRYFELNKIGNGLESYKSIF